MDLITIDLYCREYGKYMVEVVNSAEEIPKDSKEYKLVRFFMNPMTWKLHTDLVKGATILRKVKGMGGRGRGTTIEEVDWNLYKQNKALAAISSWNIVDDDGNKIPVNEETILAMNPTVLERLLDKYDDLVLVSKEREKNLIIKTFKYYQATYSGSGEVEAPPEVVELSLMEKFNWTPQQIAEIPYRKIQELFIILNQRDKTQSDSSSAKQFLASEKAKRK